MAVILCGLLTLTACGGKQKLDAKIDKYLNNPNLTIDQILHHKSMVNIDTSFLSTVAKANFDSLMKKMTELKKEQLSLCGLSEVISTEDIKAISDIRDNSTIDQNNKKEQIKNILAKNKANKKTNHKAMKQCRIDKAKELQPIKDKLATLTAACMNKTVKHGNKHRNKHDKELSVQDKTEINNQLESSACSTELAK